jgi:hypothetical protein
MKKKETPKKKRLSGGIVGYSIGKDIDAHTTDDPAMSQKVPSVKGEVRRSGNMTSSQDLHDSIKDQ